MLSKSSLLSVIKWIVVLLAYGYMVFKLVTYPSYGAFLSCFQDISLSHMVWLVACVMLMPLNFLCEVMKWHYLIRGLCKVSVWQSCRSVLGGQMGAFFTPNRLGEYPARALFLPSGCRASAVGMGFVGSLVQTLVIGLCGICCGFIFVSQVPFQEAVLWPYLFLVIGVMLVLVLSIFLLPRVGVWFQSWHVLNDWFSKFYAQLRLFSFRSFLVLFLWSTLRYIVFCSQFYLLLQFCGVSLTALESIGGIGFMYLLVTITPSVGLSDMVVRSSYALFVFSFFSVNSPGIAVASMVLWLLNTCVLMLIGTRIWISYTVKF